MLEEGKNSVTNFSQEQSPTLGRHREEGSSAPRCLSYLARFQVTSDPWRSVVLEWCEGRWRRGFGGGGGGGGRRSSPLGSPVTHWRGL